MELLIEIDNRDYRAVKAYLATGGCLGFLLAQGFWGEFKHTPSVRRRVNSLICSGELQIDADKSPVQQLSDYFTQHGQAGVALSITREATTPEADNPRPQKNRPVRPDYFIQADADYGELPTPGRVLNRGER
jgi:hypothetical protein